MKNNKPTPDRQQSWTAADRALWLAKHGAPANMRLVTDLELAVISNSLKHERAAHAHYEAQAKALRCEVDRLAEDEAILDWMQAHPMTGQDPRETHTSWAVAASKPTTLREAVKVLMNPKPTQP